MTPPERARKRHEGWNLGLSPTTYPLVRLSQELEAGHGLHENPPVILTLGRWQAHRSEIAIFPGPLA